MTPIIWFWCCCLSFSFLQYQPTPCLPTLLCQFAYGRANSFSGQYSLSFAVPCIRTDVTARWDPMLTAKRSRPYTYMLTLSLRCQINDNHDDETGSEMETRKTLIMKRRGCRCNRPTTPQRGLCQRRMPNTYHSAAAHGNNLATQKKTLCVSLFHRRFAHKRSCRQSPDALIMNLGQLVVVAGR